MGLSCSLTLDFCLFFSFKCTECPVDLKLLGITQNARHRTGLLQVTQKHFLLVEHFSWFMFSFFRMDEDWTKEIRSSISNPHLFDSGKKNTSLTSMQGHPYWRSKQDTPGCSGRLWAWNEYRSADCSDCTAVTFFFFFFLNRLIRFHLSLLWASNTRFHSEDFFSPILFYTFLQQFSLLPKVFL